MAEALYSRNRRVPTYTKSQITPLKNNYNGATPDPGYISGWTLTIDGLDSGLSISLDIRNLMTRFSVQEQITRLVCRQETTGPNVDIPAATESSTPPNTTDYRTRTNILLLRVESVLINSHKSSSTARKPA